MCGFNGVQYESECLALAGGTGVDYYGPCIHTKDTLVRRTRCEGVKCPNVLASECQLLVPPGACCPICGEFPTMSPYSHISYHIGGFETYFLVGGQSD